MFSRPRDDHTKRYVCAGRRPGHQLTIVAQPVDDLVARRVLELLTRPAFREAVLGKTEPVEDGSLGRALAALGSAQSRLQTLDDEFYVRGAIGRRLYRSIRTRSEREVERLHTLVHRESKQRIVLHPDPRQLWTEADFGQRRELLRLVVERVRVRPARRGARFDPARVRLDIPLLDVVASAVRRPVKQRGSRETGRSHRCRCERRSVPTARHGHGGERQEVLTGTRSRHDGPIRLPD